MSWFNNDSAFKSETSDKVRRFWMKNGTDREITFVDPATINFNGQQIPTPIQYMEYNLNMNGHWRNWFTRPTDDGDTPVFSIHLSFYSPQMPFYPQKTQ